MGLSEKLIRTMKRLPVGMRSTQQTVVVVLVKSVSLKNRLLGAIWTGRLWERVPNLFFRADIFGWGIGIMSNHVPLSRPSFQRRCRKVS
jgi:hypothetical protein